jgi:hypothetical protein
MKCACGAEGNKKAHHNMHEWLRGGVSPCQGEGRGFESRLVLNLNGWEVLFIGLPNFLMCL